MRGAGAGAQRGDVPILQSPRLLWGPLLPLDRGGFGDSSQQQRLSAAAGGGDALDGLGSPLASPVGRLLWELELEGSAGEAGSGRIAAAAFDCDSRRERGVGGCGTTGGSGWGSMAACSRGSGSECGRATAAAAAPRFSSFSAAVGSSSSSSSVEAACCPVCGTVVTDAVKVVW